MEGVLSPKGCQSFTAGNSILSKKKKKVVKLAKKTKFII
jgi:hypothetical protein